MQVVSSIKNVLFSKKRQYSRKRYRNPAEEKNQEYSRERYKNFSEDEKKLAEYRKRYEIYKSKNL